MSCRYLPLGLVVTLALGLSLFLAAPPVGASGGEVRVVRDRWEVQFPHRVSFSLTAEADQDLVEVQLRYRPVGSRIWSYAYPTFEPGQRITATFSLKTGGADFLPPFTRLEYYYVLRDAQGNVHQTPSVTLEYTDTRFRWEQTQIGPLVLMHYGLPRSQVNKVARQVDGELRRLSGMLQVDAASPIKGVIYNDRPAAVEAFPHQSRTITEQHVFEGFAFPERGVFLSLGLEPGLIIHESAHLLLHQALGTGAPPVPAWLDEGFAGYVEPGTAPYRAESLSAADLPLQAMSTIPGTPQAISNFYLKAESVVAYLVEVHGVESFQQFLGQLRRGQDVGQAMVQTYGFDIPGLDTLWASDRRGRPVPGPRSQEKPSPFVYFDVWVFGLLALVVMAALLVRYGIGRLRPDRDPKEGLQPWEDPDWLEDGGNQGNPR